MLKKRIAKSEKFAALKSDKARLLYLLMLPHLDAEGRLEGDYPVIKGEVCPYLNEYTERVMTKCLRELAEIGLITLYAIGGRRYIEWVRFDDFNRINKEKEAPSYIPPPDSGVALAELRSNSGVTPSKVKDKVKVKDKEKGAAELSTNIYSEFLTHWKSKANLPGIREFTEQRKKKLKARMADPLFAANWREIIDRLSASNFCTGTNDRGWRADVDWLLKNSTNGAKVLEGKYDDKPKLGVIPFDPEVAKERERTLIGE